MIGLRCQRCDAEMSVPDSLCGQFEACPACGALVSVPGPYVAELPPSWRLARSDRGGRVPVDARRSRRVYRAAIWSSTLIGAVLLVVGLAGAISLDPAVASGCRLLAVVGGLFAAIGLGLIPGAVASDRGLANADGIFALGLFGVLLPIIWLVALVLALAGSPAGGRAGGWPRP